MGMNIKNPEAHALAREIAARAGLSLTDAVLRRCGRSVPRSPTRRRSGRRPTGCSPMAAD